MKILQIIGKEFILSHPSAAISYAKILPTSGKSLS